MPSLEGSRHGPVSAFAAVQEQASPAGDGGDGPASGALAALAAEVLEAACLLATDPVAGVAALGTALLRQIDVEVAVAALPGPRTQCELVFLAPADLTPIPWQRCLPGCGRLTFSSLHLARSPRMYTC